MCHTLVLITPFLSTLSLRRATFYRSAIENQYSAISIHALLAESDRPATRPAQNLLNFYPRSPCGERQRPYYPQSRPLLFLSTLSLRRATCIPRSDGLWQEISIHALLAESDVFCFCLSVFDFLFLSTLSLRRATLFFIGLHLFNSNFYPRSPCGERLLIILCSISAPCISIHALLAESDSQCLALANGI